MHGMYRHEMLAVARRPAELGGYDYSDLHVQTQIEDALSMQTCMHALARLMMDGEDANLCLSMGRSPLPAECMPGATND